MARTLTIDLTTELGEGFAVEPAGIPLSTLQTLELPETGRKLHSRHTAERADHTLIPLISSAYLACGLHSGDPVYLSRLIADLMERGVRIGAHPSYPDMFNFAQNSMDLNGAEVTACILYQFGALNALLKPYGEKIRYVKCHGALNFDVAAEAWAAEAMIDAVKAFDSEIIVVTPAETQTISQLEDAGLRVARECFADRGYDQQGHILRRDHPNALIKTSDAAVAQILSIMTKGEVTAFDGTRVPMRADTVCLHSDTPGAAEFGRDLVEKLRAAGFDIKSFNGTA